MYYVVVEYDLSPRSSRWESYWKLDQQIVKAVKGRCKRTDFDGSGFGLGVRDLSFTVRTESGARSAIKRAMSVDSSIRATYTKARR